MADLPDTIGFRKQVLGDYVIETVNPDGSSYNEIILKSGQVRIYGDLVVTGDQTTITETNLAVKDRLILLNEGETGAGVTDRFSGLEVDRGSSNNALLVFDENDDAFKISYDGGSTYATIATSAGGGSALTDVVDDTSPQLGGNLDVNTQSIVSTTNGDITLAPDGTGTVKIENSELALDLLASSPSAQAGYNLLFHKAEGSGGTGLYFRTTSTHDELVSKSKAIVYGIIF